MDRKGNPDGDGGGLMRAILDTIYQQYGTDFREIQRLLASAVVPPARRATCWNLDADWLLPKEASFGTE